MLKVWIWDSDLKFYKINIKNLKIKILKIVSKSIFELQKENCKKYIKKIFEKTKLKKKGNKKVRI